jgi:hypothetical protein
VLAETPNTHHRPSNLARKVSIASPYSVEEHSIEQTICWLRRKRGESAKDERLLLGRRGLGYALMIEEVASPSKLGVLAYTPVRAHG